MVGRVPKHTGTATLAVDRLLSDKVELNDYRLQSTTSGPDALAEVYVKVQYHGHSATGRGVDNDVLTASAKAMLMPAPVADAIPWLLLAAKSVPKLVPECLLNLMRKPAPAAA